MWTTFVLHHIHFGKNHGHYSIMFDRTCFRLNQKSHFYHIEVMVGMVEAIIVTIQTACCQLPTCWRSCCTEVISCCVSTLSRSAPNVLQ